MESERKSGIHRTKRGRVLIRRETADPSAQRGPGDGGELDQRREPRRSADGVVVVRFGQPPQEFRGRLMDVSTSGFRIAHEYVTLETGQTVEFSHPEADGKARVVWNRISGSGVESGFFVVKL